MTGFCGSWWKNVGHLLTLKTADASVPGFSVSALHSYHKLFLLSEPLLCPLWVIGTLASVSAVLPRIGEKIDCLPKPKKYILFIYN